MTSVALTAAQTSRPGTSSSSATAAEVTSATQGMAPASSIRTPAGCHSRPTTVAGQTLRGLPAGRDRCSATAVGPKATSAGLPAATAVSGAVAIDGTRFESDARGRCRTAEQVDADEARHVVGSWMSGDVERCPLLHDASVLDDDDAVAEHEGVERVVRHQHDAAGEAVEVAA